MCSKYFERVKILLPYKNSSIVLYKAPGKYSKIFTGALLDNIRQGIVSITTYSTHVANRLRVEG